MNRGLSGEASSLAAALAAGPVPANAAERASAILRHLERGFAALLSEAENSPIVRIHAATVARDLVSVVRRYALSVEIQQAARRESASRGRGRPSAWPEREMEAGVILSLSFVGEEFLAETPGRPALEIIAAIRGTIVSEPRNNVRRGKRRLRGLRLLRD